MISVEGLKKQKIRLFGSKGSGTILFNNNVSNEGMIAFVWNGVNVAAKLLFARTSYSVPSLYYGQDGDGNYIIAVVMSETWGQWLFSSNNRHVPTTGEMISDLTGLTQVNIQP